MLESFAVETEHFTWSAYAAGEGADVWIGFHGFGQGGQHLLRYMRLLRPNSRCIAFDLPHHGATVDKGKSPSPLLPIELARCLELTLMQLGAERASLLGFSLGGKCVLQLIASRPDAIREIILIAPDGLYINPIYWFATHTSIGKRLMLKVVSDPRRLLAIMDKLRTLRLLHPNIHAFFVAQLAQSEQRIRVYKVWQTFGAMQPHLPTVRRHVAAYSIPLTLVFGRFDKVIRPFWASRMSGRKCPSAKLILLDRAHDLTKRESANELAVVLNAK